jgi:hypothetical protein
LKIMLLFFLNPRVGVRLLRTLGVVAAFILPACGSPPAPPAESSGLGRIYGDHLLATTIPVLLRPGGTYLAGNRAGDWHITALREDGSVEWARQIGGADYDLLSGAAVAQDGGIVAVGGYGLSPSSADVWAVRLNPDGSMRWQERFGIAGQGQAVHATADGGFVIGAHWGGTGPWICKLDADGAIVWQYTYITGDLWALQPAAGGGYLGSVSFSAVPGLLSVFKIDDSGIPLWGKTYDDGMYDYAHSIAATADGGCIVAGQGSVNVSGTIDYNLLTLKIAADGSFGWMTKVGGPDYEEANGAVELPGGDILVCGLSIPPQRSLLLRLKSDGTVLSQQSCPSPGYHDFKSIRLGPANNAWILGETTTYGGPDPLSNPTSTWFLQTTDDYRLPVPMAASSFTVTTPTVTVTDSLPFANAGSQSPIATSVTPVSVTVSVGPAP